MRYKAIILSFILSISWSGSASAQEAQLIRRPWIQAEKDRLLDWMSGMQKRKGLVRGQWWMKDSQGRGFSLTVAGLDFFPFETMPANVPRDSDAPFHMAEAEALYRAGNAEQASRIWKTFHALAALDNLPAYQKKASREAANKLEKATVNFVGPVVLYRTEQNRTLVSHPEHGYRLTLPGEFAAARFRLKEGGKSRPLHPAELHTLALRRQIDLNQNQRKEIIIIVSSDAMDSVATPQACRGLWRDRAGLTPGQINSRGIREQIQKLEDSELVLRVADRTEGSWIEFFRIRQSMCFHLRVIVPEYSIMATSMENALVLEGREFEDKLERYDGDRAMEVFQDLYPTLAGP